MDTLASLPSTERGGVEVILMVAMSLTARVPLNPTHCTFLKEFECMRWNVNKTCYATVD